VRIVEKSDFELFYGEKSLFFRFEEFSQ